MIPPVTGNSRGVVTHGIGRQTTAHLNLTRTLADVGRKPTVDHANRFSTKAAARKRESHSNKVPYAGSTR